MRFSIDGYSTTTDVHIYRNGIEVYGANFNMSLGGTLTTAEFTSYMNVNDILEVAVGRGSNGNYFSDSTGVEFTVTNYTKKSMVKWHQLSLGTGRGIRPNRVIAKVRTALDRWSSGGRTRRLA